MAKRWKKLEKKYRNRRILLIIVGVVVLLVIGIYLGMLLTQNIGTEKEISLELTPAEAELGLSEEESSETESVLATPVTADAVVVENLDSWKYIIVSSKSQLADDFSVELERISGEFTLDARVAVPFKQMIADAKAEGINLKLYSAYRSPKEQEALFQEELNRLIDRGAKVEEAYVKAEEKVSPPWLSEHHTGLAVDISTPEIELGTRFDQTAAFTWLTEHAWEYGFILRYGEGKEGETNHSYDPCHFRYVGKEAAKVIWENGYSLEGYLYAKEQLEQLVQESSGATDISSDSESSQVLG